MSITAQVVRHITSEKLGTFSHVFTDRNIDFQYIEAAHDDLKALDPLEADLFFVMGGPCGAYDADHYTFLKDEINILEKRIAAGKPTIGVCLGSQLMARALGAKVYKGEKGNELGWHPISVNEQGMQSPVAHLDKGQTNMFHWHGDTFDLPDGAVLLASSENYPHQIYKYQDHALGIQCHPEVTHKMLKEWFILFVDFLTGDNPALPLEDLRTQTQANIETLHLQTKKFLNQWIDEVLE